jgi:LemA protein
VALQESCAAAWAQVDTVLQRRFDLIPNLVNTVKGYAAHEKGILEEVARLRSQWASATTPAAKAQIATQMEGAIARLLLVAEQYPDLKASANFRDLQVQLEGAENRIAVERQRYNDALRAYNTKIRQFPGTLIAGLRGCQPNTAYFEAVPAAKDAPKVDFNTTR